MRLIDADLLTTELIKISGAIPVNEDVAISEVDSMPTVRAVPLVEFTCVQQQLILRNAQLLDAEEKMKSMVSVVRCKDCVNAEKQEGRLFCHVWRLVNGHGDDGYCCYGERRDVDD